MKMRKFLVLLTTCLVICGCNKEQPANKQLAMEQPISTELSNADSIDIKVDAKNEIFTSERFKNLTGIEDIYASKKISQKEDMQKICNALAGLSLKQTSKPELNKYGGLALAFVYADGKEVTIILQGEELYCDDKRYYIDHDIYDLICTVFGKATTEPKKTQF